MGTMFALQFISFRHLGTKNDAVALSCWYKLPSAKQERFQIEMAHENDLGQDLANYRAWHNKNQLPSATNQVAGDHYHDDMQMYAQNGDRKSKFPNSPQLAVINCRTSRIRSWRHVINNEGGDMATSRDVYIWSLNGPVNVLLLNCRLLTLFL